MGIGLGILLIMTLISPAPDQSASLTTKTTPLIVWAPRPVVVERLLERALSQSVIRVRGTPSSGKTVLMHLFHEKIARNLPGLKFHVTRGWPDHLSFEGSQRFLEERLGVPRDELLSAKNTIVLIDDA